MQHTSNGTGQVDIEIILFSDPGQCPPTDGTRTHQHRQEGMLWVEGPHGGLDASDNEICFLVSSVLSHPFIPPSLPLPSIRPSIQDLRPKTGRASDPSTKGQPNSLAKAVGMEMPASQLLGAQHQLLATCTQGY